MTGIDDHIPTYEAQLETSISKGDGLGDELVTDKVTAETLNIQSNDGYDGLNQLLSKEKESEFIPKESEKPEIVVTDSNPLPVIPVTSQIGQAIQPSPDLSFDLSSESSPLKTDFSTFPHLTSKDCRAKENLALKIKAEMLACATCEELAQFNLESGYSESAIAWVIQNALSETEKSDLEVINSISQPSLNLSISAPTVEMVFETVEVPVVTEPENLDILKSEESAVVLAENAESFVFELGDLGRFGQIIKDKMSGQLYKVLEIKANGYWCRNAEGCYLMILFADALTDLDSDDF
jgi:hypothetical protein